MNASGLQHSIEKNDIQYFEPSKILRNLAELWKNFFIELSVKILRQKIKYKFFVMNRQ